MTLKDKSQLCSFELAKNLKELNINDGALFWWIRRNTNDLHLPHIVLGMPHFTFQDHQNLVHEIPIWEIETWDIFPAYTVAELGEILFQKNYENLEQTSYLHINTEMIDRSGGYFYRITNNLTDHIIDELNEADARAKLLIYLTERGLLK